jgi:hypothetical protein
MTETINFKEMVKMIHPDTNPSIIDAGGKMSQVMSNRKDSSYLYTLAVRWGLIGSGKPFTEKVKETVREILFDITLGTVMFRNGRKKIVVGFGRVTRGRNKGQHKIFMYDTAKDKVYYTATHTLKNVNKDCVYGFMTTDGVDTGAFFTRGKDLLNRVNNTNSRMDSERKAQKDARARNNSGIRVGDTVFVRTRGIRVTVTRRTAKRVYFNGGFANLSSVTAI